MKIIVTHASPDLDAITSVWLLRSFLPDWHDAKVEFVPAGQRTPKIKTPDLTEVVETQGSDEYIHVDTGLGPLDHHQIDDQNVCGASRTWDYVKQVHNTQPKNESSEQDRWEVKEEAIGRMVKIVVDYDHFREVFWENPTADYHDFTLEGMLEGLKLQRVDDDNYYVEYVCLALDAVLHNFQNRIWAEREISMNGKKFTTKKGEGIGFETLNDTVVKLSQKMGYVIVIRKDPRKGYVRIKARPVDDIDLTLAYEQLKKADPDATWFLHISKKMLLNGSVKNPNMRPTSLPLDAIIGVIKSTV